MPKTKGFTLIELMIAISIIAIMATVGIVIYTGTRASARDAKRRGDLEDIKKALYLYKQDNNVFCLGGTYCNTTPFQINVWDTTYGLNGTHAYSLKTNLIDKGYIKAIPQDPSTKDTSEDYHISILTNDSFLLSAKLETPPTSNPGCTPATGRNYCISD